LNVDPLLNNPTYSGTGASLSAFTLQAGSPAFGAGVNVCGGIAGCSMGSRDFFGNAITTAGTHTIGAQDIPAPLSQLADGGFESGNCSSWGCWGGASVAASNARTGTYALQLPANASASTGGQQTVTGLTANTTYQLQGFAKSSVAGQCIYLGVKNFGGTEARTCLSATSYTGGTVTFTTGASNTSATVYLWNPSTNTATGYADDVTVGKVPALHNYGALVNAASSTCLDIANASTSAGAAAQLYSCNTGANQSITVASNGQLQVYAASNQKCLDTSSGATSAGTAVVTQNCNTGSTTQKWSVTGSGTITNTASGLCLGPAGGATADFTALQIQTCTGAANQKWNRQ